MKLGLLVFVVSGALCIACGSSESSGEDEAPSAADEALTNSNGSAIVPKSGVFGEGLEELEVIVPPSPAVERVVRGRLRAAAMVGSVGALSPDPQATCELTFTGLLESNRTSVGVDVADVNGESTGTLSFEGRGVSLRLERPSSGCRNAYYRSGDFVAGIHFDRKRDVERYVVGYRTVQADRAYFYDRASSGERRSAYIVKGQTVKLLSPDVNGGRVLATYTSLEQTPRSTSGYLETSDFVDLSRGVYQILGLD